LGILSSVVLAASCSTTIPPNETGNPTSTVVQSAPAGTGPHLRWAKATNNLSPTNAEDRFKLAARSGGSPTYVAIDELRDVWLSDDGTVWRHLPRLPGTRVTHGLAAFQGRLIAFESDRTTAVTRAGPWEGTLAGYTAVSDDGVNWVLHPAPAGFVTGIVDNDHLLALGGRAREDAPTFGVTTDGIDWTVETATGDVWARTAEGCWLSNLRFSGSAASGFVVTASSSCVADADGVLLYSSDLRSWAPPDLPPVGACSEDYDVIHGPWGFVALATPSSDDGNTCVWRSPNGGSWMVATALPADMQAGLDRLALAPDGTYLAYGAKIWESTDGDHWFESASATNAYVYEIAGDLAIACGESTCSSLRMTAP